MDSLFADGFPEGKIEYYVENDTRSRTTRDETRLLNLNMHEIETSMRKGAEVHKEVLAAKHVLQTWRRPGVSLQPGEGCSLGAVWRGGDILGVDCG